MKKVILNFEINHLAGSKFGTAGDIIAGHLMAAQGVSDPIKFYNWGLKFYKGDAVDMDQSDFKKFKEFVEGHQQLIVLVKGPILTYLENLKAETE